jgi:hypothetical protein
MSLTAAQICARAAQIARVPGFLSQAGDSLNMVLQELCQDYDFDVAKQTYGFNFNTSQLNYNGQAFQNFPSNYLRGIRNECWYFISGVPYPMIPLDLNEFDMLVEQAGVSNFPIFFAVDMSGNGFLNSTVLGTPGALGVPVAVFWMPPSGAYAMTVRYYSQMPDIANPSTSSTVPWFPNTNYLVTRVAGELMKDADDERATAYLSDDDKYPNGAGTLLRKYLMMKDDKENRSNTVQLDRRRFGRAYDRLQNTKTIGWGLALIISVGINWLSFNPWS